MEGQRNEENMSKDIYLKKSYFQNPNQEANNQFVPYNALNHLQIFSDELSNKLNCFENGQQGYVGEGQRRALFKHADATGSLINNKKTSMFDGREIGDSPEMLAVKRTAANITRFFLEHEISKNKYTFDSDLRTIQSFYTNLKDACTRYLDQKKYGWKTIWHYGESYRRYQLVKNTLTRARAESKIIAGKAKDYYAYFKDKGDAERPLWINILEECRTKELNINYKDIEKVECITGNDNVQYIKLKADPVTTGYVIDEERNVSMDKNATFNNAKIDENANATGRCVATYRLAELLGIPALVTAVAKVKYHDKYNNMKKGRLMTEKEGERVSVTSIFRDFQDVPYDLIVQLNSLRILDLLTGRLERKADTILFCSNKFTNEFSDIMVKPDGMSFGKLTYKEISSRTNRPIKDRNGITISVIGENFYNNVLALDDSIVKYLFADLLSQEDIEYFLDRIHGVQKQLRRLVESNAVKFYNDNTRREYSVIQANRWDESGGLEIKDYDVFGELKRKEDHPYVSIETEKKLERDADPFTEYYEYMNTHYLGNDPLTGVPLFSPIEKEEIKINNDPTITESNPFLAYAGYGSEV